MDLREITEYRTPIGIGLVLLVLLSWYANGYRPRSEHLKALEARSASLTRDRDQVLADIARAQAEVKEPKMLPARAVAAPAPGMSAVDRLNYFLANITKPANALELSYFTVTPLSPASGPGYEEIPFLIAVAGSYAALADYLYQLEYAQDFLVRDVNVTQRDGAVQADFRLSALLLNESAAQAPAKPGKDPGRPTSLELARDPFIRPPAKVAIGPDGKNYFLNVPAGLHLSGTMKGGNGMVAIINHEPYPVGASIENKTITKITDRGVELADKVRSYFLEMEQPTYSSAAPGSRTKEALGR
jgi:Tfp pilus assembly protein PilO